MTQLLMRKWIAIQLARCAHCYVGEFGRALVDALAIITIRQNRDFFSTAINHTHPSSSKSSLSLCRRHHHRHHIQNLHNHVFIQILVFQSFAPRLHPCGHLHTFVFVVIIVILSLDPSL